MKDSKEALEHICKTCDNKSCPYIHYEKSRCVWYGNIKQDLDQLELLKEKATPKRPITIKSEGTSIFDYPTNRIKCPTCGVQLPMKKNCLKKKVPITHCDRCGQKLDWSDANE